MESLLWSLHQLFFHKYALFGLRLFENQENIKRVKQIGQLSALIIYILIIYKNKQSEAILKPNSKAINEIYIESAH